MNVQENYIQEDEIDLRELFGTIKRDFFKIVLFVFIVTSLTIAYVLTLPNVYKSEVILAPQTQSKPSLGGLSALAGMAGVDLGGGEVDTFEYLNIILSDKQFNTYMIEKYNLQDKIDGNETNFVFALGYRDLYDYLHKKENQEAEPKSKEDILFETTKTLQTTISLTSDKKSGVMTLVAEHSDRFLAKELVDIYLLEATNYLRTLDMKDTNQKIEFYREEISKTADIELKQSLSSLVSSLIQKSVLSKSSDFYLVKPIGKPEVAYVKDKVKPKRGLIVVVSFVTSFILGIFGVFFIEFLKNDKKEEDKLS